MDYNQTLNYLFEQLPMYQRVGNAAYKTNLDNTHRLCKLLGNPEKEIKTIHIAGTNGKGSTSHMIASVLHEAGYKVGLYTSPHLKDFRERIKINGKMISEENVIDFVAKYRVEFEQINLSFFEWTVGLAFSYFNDEKVDVAVIETGLGGRLDSTNVIDPEVAVITNIGMDHVQFLGTTLKEIALEKAGIIKEGVPVVIGETQEEIKTVFIEKSKKLDVPLFYADTNVHGNYQTDLKGVYQQKNVKTAIQAIHLLKNRKWQITEQNLTEGLKNVVRNTGLLGRWQTLGVDPAIICDVGHNEAGMSEIVQQINSTRYKKLHFILGVVNDKTIDKILQLLPKKATYYFCKANIPRALPVEELHEAATKHHLKGFICDTVALALDMAERNAQKEDLIFIGGSTFVVAEVL